jgi:signal transduction histidine kinase
VVGASDNPPFTGLVIEGTDHSAAPYSHRSLKRRIQILGCFVGAMLVCAAVVSFHMFHMTMSARIPDTARHLMATLDRLVHHYERQAAFNDASLIEHELSLRTISTDNLADAPGVEGGFYTKGGDRLLGYAYPTYLGSGPKTDIPAAERPAITRLVHQAILAGVPVQEHAEHGFDVILFAAAPLAQSGRIVGAAWLMHRLPGIRNPQWQYYSVGLLSLVLMAAIAAGGAWLIARRLDRAIAGMVDGIHTLQDSGSRPIPAAGYAEIDRVVSAINHLVRTVRLQQHRREQLERQLQQADRLAILGRLVAGVAHEVRNPLSSIRLKLQLARRGPVELERLVAAFDVVEQEISRLDRLVARLLSVAKPATVGLQPTDMNQFLAARLQHWQARASESGILVKYAGVLDHAASLHIDRDRVGQILDNLMGNAWEALAGAGGTILVSLIRPDDASFSITVADSGPGVSPEARSHLFEPFFTTKPQGTGLGLFLSAEMARASGGRLAYVDSPHGGGCFELSLPSPPPASDVSEEPAVSQRQA